MILEIKHLGICNIENIDNTRDNYAPGKSCLRDGYVIREWRGITDNGSADSEPISVEEKAIRRASATRPIDQQGHLGASQSNQLLCSEPSRFIVWRHTLLDPRASQMIFRELFVCLKNDIRTSIRRFILDEINAWQTITFNFMYIYLFVVF